MLETGRLDHNLGRMGERARALGVRLRPHLKTAKSYDVARLATAGEFGGITVSTLAEAEYFLAGGITDLLYAVGIVPSKLPRAARLVEAGAHLTLILDSVETARAVAAFADLRRVAFAVLIEIDTGEGRSGVLPEAADLVEIGTALEQPPYCRLQGVITHAGHSYAARDLETVARIAEAERSGAVRAAERLRAAGLSVPVVSVGSTPTALHARHLSGVTELRAGVYMFGDLFQAQIGSCTLDDLAVSVLATVTGHHRDAGHLLIDAGALALSKDRSTADAPHDYGFGLLVHADGTPFAQELRIFKVYQEHGLVRAADGALPFDELPIGAQVRVLPNHVCMTAAMYDRYHLVKNGALAGEWTRTNGW
ncbi:alanine racemase [Aliidongia dinghuensis]|uniref:Alanine racemase n=2 Tax=Aliidongia dinghuensis TaxID=1867774 RepID=A0A8J2Z017_9PROT|nr:alanine racemase [Aliidongia dinghuensis]